MRPHDPCVRITMDMDEQLMLLLHVDDNLMTTFYPYTETNCINFFDTEHLIDDPLTATKMKVCDNLCMTIDFIIEGSYDFNQFDVI